MGESGEYVVVWYGNTELKEKRQYHSAIFDDFGEALDYYDTTAHGWPTGGKGPEAENGIGNSRIFFQKSWVTPVWASSIGYQPPTHWWKKMIDIAIQSHDISRYSGSHLAG